MEDLDEVEHVLAVTEGVEDRGQCPELGLVDTGRDLVQAYLAAQEVRVGYAGNRLEEVARRPIGLDRPQSQPGLAGLLIVRGSSPEGTGYFVDGSDVRGVGHAGIVARRRRALR